jgi:hypothetical protein
MRHRQSGLAGSSRKIATIHPSCIFSAVCDVTTNVTFWKPRKSRTAGGTKNWQKIFRHTPGTSKMAFDFSGHSHFGFTTDQRYQQNQTPDEKNTPCASRRAKSMR